MENLKEYLTEVNILKRIQYLNKKLKNKKIILYGTGKLFMEIIKNYDLSNLNIIAVTDIKYYNLNTISKDFGYNIVPVNQINSLNPDIILVSTLKTHSIIKNLKTTFKDSNIDIIPLVKESFKTKIKSIYKTYTLKRESNIQKQIDTIHKILNLYVDISKLKSASGDMRKVQLDCLTILKEIKKICKANKLTYWLEGGTLLGAYRHNGFIPWDDDIDICMPREDYNKILPILYEYFKNSQYFVRERAETCNNFQIRIINKVNTLVGVDIFPVDYYIKGNLTHEEKLSVHNNIIKAAKIFKRKYKKKYYNSKEIEKAKKDISLIQNTIVNKGEKTNCKNPALYFGIDYQYSVNGFLVFENDVIFPLSEIEFEDDVYPCPNKARYYLENIYGDIMSFPKII